MKRKLWHFFVGLLAIVTAPVWGPFWFIALLGQVILGDLNGKGLDNNGIGDPLHIDRNSSSFDKVNREEKK